jgi:hypothetical protein
VLLNREMIEEISERTWRRRDLARPILRAIDDPNAST